MSDRVIEVHRSWTDPEIVCSAINPSRDANETQELKRGGHASKECQVIGPVEDEEAERNVAEALQCRQDLPEWVD